MIPEKIRQQLEKNLTQFEMQDLILSLPTIDDEDRMEFITMVFNHPTACRVTILKRLLCELLVHYRVLDDLKYKQVIELVPHFISGGAQDEFVCWLRHVPMDFGQWGRIVNAYNEEELKASCRIGYDPLLVDDDEYCSPPTDD